MIKHVSTLFDYFRGKGDIRGNNQVTRAHLFNYCPVSHVKSFVHLHKTDKAGIGHTNWLVCHEYHLYFSPFSRTKQYFFDNHGARVTVHPNFHWNNPFCNNNYGGIRKRYIFLLKGYLSIEMLYLYLAHSGMLGKLS